VWKQHERAYRAARDTITKLCRQAYAQARTAADSQVVHGTIFWDTSRFVPLTCDRMWHDGLRN